MFLPALSEDEAREAKRIFGDLDKSRDDVENITWARPQGSEELRNSVYLYLGHKDMGATWLRWKIRYCGSDWLFIEKYRIKVGQQNPVTLLPSKQVHRDNSGGTVWEVFDEPAEEHAELLNQILAGDSVVVRMEGSRSVRDVSLDQTDIQRMKDVLLVYRLSGGKWPAPMGFLE